MKRSLEIILITITITFSFIVKSNELDSNIYEACDSTSNSIECEEYVKNCSDNAEGSMTAYDCLDIYLNNLGYM